MKLKTIAIIVNLSLMLILIGASLNYLAVSSNCSMPVLSNNFKNHYLIENKTQVNNYYLTDIIGFETETFLLRFSIGDLIAVIGIFIFIPFLFKLIYFKNETI